MKILGTLAAAIVFGLAVSSSSTVADDDRSFRVGPRGITLGPSWQHNQQGYDAYGRRLQRYRNNYGYGNYYNNYYGNQRFTPWNNYGNSRGWTNDYRNMYRTNPYSGNWYQSRPGLSFGNGGSGFYFSF